MLSASILLSKGIFQVILLVCFHERKELLTSLFLPIVLFSQILLITHISQKKKNHTWDSEVKKNCWLEKPVLLYPLSAVQRGVIKQYLIIGILTLLNSWEKGK